MTRQEIHEFQRSEKRQYRLLFALWVLCLIPVVIVARLLPSRSRNRNGQSIVSEARAAAQSTLPFVYMS